MFRISSILLSIREVMVMSYSTSAVPRHLRCLPDRRAGKASSMDLVELGVRMAARKADVLAARG
jgi:hypothetical protein